MVTRMDHVVVLVHDLEHCTQEYRTLGFVVAPGGRHIGFGTENSLVRFDLDYIELLGLRDPDEARQGRFGGETFIETVEAGGGLISYALATDSLTDDVARLRAAGVDCSDPFPMRRERPDGVVLEWRLAYPGGPPWGQPLPFLIQWDTPDAVRLPTAPPQHPLGAGHIARVAVRAKDPEGTAGEYRVLLGREPVTGRRHRFQLGQLTIDILPAGPDPEGIYEVDLAVPMLAIASGYLAERDVDVDHMTDEDGERVAVDPAAACGARFFLVQR
ncbi:MAG TPA: VOC family protein [Dehalococcoidia bacterium]|nr:VOC family protein [Dehalococcoidia bacterium]